MFDTDEVLEFNKLNDNTLVIIQHDGIEIAWYKYVPLFKATMKYKKMDPDKKKVYKTLTFTIRKGLYDNKINYIDTDGFSLDFHNLEAVEIYLKDKYGTFKLNGWSV